MTVTSDRVAQNFIDGTWVEPRSGRYAPDLDPSNQRVIAQIAQSIPADVDGAVSAARAAFPAWKRTSALKRGQLLVQASRLLEECKDQLFPLLTQEQGKPLAEARGEVLRAVDFWSWMGHQGGSIQGITAREPLGVVALITPWNFPVNVPGWKLASALVCGNTVVFKPSGLTPLCAEFLVRVLQDAGLPPGVLNLVQGSGREVGDALVAHPDVAA